MGKVEPMTSGRESFVSGFVIRFAKTKGALLAMCGFSLWVAQACYMPPEEQRMGSGYSAGTEGTERTQRANDPQPATRGRAADNGEARDPSDPMAAARDGRAPPMGARQPQRPINHANRLAHEAQGAMQARDYATAARKLEQALGYEPERGVLWQHLATVRYHQREYETTERLALRAVDLAGDDIDLLRESWWLVAAARAERGDTAGARDAAAVARRFGESGEYDFSRSR